MGHSFTHRAAYGERICPEQAKLHELKIKAEAEQLKKQERKDKIITKAITIPLIAATLGFAAWDVKHTDWEARNRALATKERTKAEAVLQTIANCETCQKEFADPNTVRHQHYHADKKDWAEWVLQAYTETDNERGM